MKKLSFSTIYLIITAVLIFGFTGKDSEYLNSDLFVKKIAVDSILNNTWILNTLNGKEVVKEKAGDEMPYLEFHLKDGSLSGNTGCNSIYGNAKVTDDEITFSDISVTKMFCADAQYEQDFLNTLFVKTAMKYKFSGYTLEIFKDDAAVMTLKFKDK